MTTATVIDATDDTFIRDVVDRSHEVPVIVDFWAPWCGPCQMLGPVLEGLAQEYVGRLQLVKVNTDENPAVAQAHQIQSIPAVFAYRDGEPVNQFLGALPAPQVREFIDGLLPSEAEVLTRAALEALAAGDLEGGERELRAALEADSSHVPAVAGLAELLIERGDLDEAEALISGFSWDPRVATQIGRLQMARTVGDSDRAALEARLEANDGDVDAHYRLGCIDVVEQRWDEAFDHFLEVVMLDRGYEDDAARLRALDIIERLQATDPQRAQAYRQRLTNVLF